MACGLCGKAIVPGLRFGNKGANQAMTPAGIGRIHVDKRLCKALEGVTYEELERRGRAALSEAPLGSLDHDAINRVLHPVVGVGVDKDGDGR